MDHLVSDYGLLGIFLGAGIEGETVVTLGGMMAHRGIIAFWPAVAAAALGSFIADQLFFLMGRRFRNHAYVRKLQNQPAFSKTLASFEKYPKLFVFIFRFIYGFRTISPIAIGTTNLPARTFMLINAGAAATWGLIFVTAGYWFGQIIESLFGRIRSLEHILLIPAAIAIIIAIAWRLIRKSPKDVRHPPQQ